MSALLAIEGLDVRLPSGGDRPYALRNVSLTLERNEILCVVGASGSGKSMLTSAIMGLLPPGTRADAGRIMFEGRDLLRLDEAGMRQVRGAQIGMIFQEPMTALNPLRRIGSQIAEMYRLHTNLSGHERRARVLDRLDSVGIPDPAKAFAAYPHQLSGGQRQRAMIAMALALEPRLLIADEPTTALDVTTQAQILALIRDVQRRTGTAVLFITHDFGVVEEIADRVAVVQDGKIVESGATKALLQDPQDPTTRALIAAIPSMVPPPERVVSERAMLTVGHVCKTYQGSGLLRRWRRTTVAVADVSLTLPQGGTLGIVGESGSGKSTLARCIVGALKPDSGTIRVGGVDLASLRGRALRRERRRVQMVHQDPSGSLNPRRRVGGQVAQGAILNGTPATEARARTAELFTLVGLDPAGLDRYPHEFSGGQRQRICLARALAVDPEVLIADEPVSALDVSVQAQVLAVLADLRDRLGLSMVFVTHDLRVAAQVCDRIAVMKNGRVVEEASAVDLFHAPQHPYTKALLAAVPGQAWQPASGTIGAGAGPGPRRRAGKFAS